MSEAEYRVPTKTPKIGYDKTWGSAFGRDNSPLIVNALLAEEIESDEVVGIMISEFLYRTYQADTIFSRYEDARIRDGFEIDEDRCWAWGVNPSERVKL